MKKLLLIVVAMIASLAVYAAPSELYIFGPLIQGWDCSAGKGQLMTRTSDGVFEGDFVFDGTKYFGFTSVMNGNWEDCNNNRYKSAAEKDCTVKDGSVVKLGIGDGCFILGAGEYHFTVDTNQMIFKVASTKEVKVDISWAVKGNFFTGSWDNNSTVAMTLENGKWVLEKEVKAGEFGVKTIENGNLDSQAEWYSFSNADSDINANLGKSLALLDSSNERTNGKVSEAGTYRFVVDPSALTLTVTKVGGGDEPGPIEPDPIEPDPQVSLPENIWIVGHLALTNAKWNVDGVEGTALTKNGTDYTINNVEIVKTPDAADNLNGYFRFYTISGNWDKGHITPTSNDFAVVDGAMAAIYNKDKKNDDSWMIEPGKYNMTISFADAANPTLTVTAVGGGDEPEPPVQEEGKDFRFMGQGFGYDSNSPAFTYKDGVYTLNNLELRAENNSFSIQTPDYKNCYGNKEATVSDSNLSVTLYEGGYNNVTLKLKGVYNVTFSEKTLVVTFTKVADLEPEKIECPEELYLIGHVKDRVDQYGWDATKALKLKKEGRVFTYEKVPFIGANGTQFGYFRFSEAAGDWSVVDKATQYGAESADKDVENNVEMSLEKGYNSFKIAAGLYNITVEFGDYEATITVVPFKHAQPVIKHNGEVLGHGSTVKVVPVNLGDETDPYYVVMYDVELPAGASLFAALPMHNGGNGGGMDPLKIRIAEEDEDITLDGKYYMNVMNWIDNGQLMLPAEDGEHSFVLVENGHVGDVLTVTTQNGTTGISAIEAEAGEAVYFNFQGQRVANPEKGMYIRVVNGKAVKVVK